MGRRLVGQRGRRTRSGGGWVRYTSASCSNSRLRDATVRGGADAIDVTEVGGAAVSLEFAITVRPVGDLIDLAEEVRQEVIGELRRSADLEVAKVDVTIQDVMLDESN